ncbi:MAG: DUF2341 domain-containing protein, partial [Candidatus Kariarchaeaceae archaeon]
MLVLLILIINFSTAGFILGGNLLNNVVSKDNSESNLIDNSFFNDTLNYGSENYNVQEDRSHSINDEPRSINQIPNSKFKVQTWEKPNFEYRKNITIDSTKVSGSSSLTDFPILIDIYDSDLRTKVQSDGDDIIFTNTTGTKLDHEIEEFNQTYNGTHAHLITWVRIPSLSGTTDTVVTMYYGNSTIGPQENPTAVWNSNYVGIYHMNNDPSSTAPQMIDSTTNNNDGTSYGTMQLNDVVTGVSGNGIDFDGTNDYIDLGNPASMQITGAITLETWLNVDTVGNDYILAKLGGGGQRGWDLSFDDDAGISPDGWVMFRLSTDGTSMISTGYERVNASQWTHIVGVFQPSSYTQLFVNGQKVGEKTTGIPATQFDPSVPIRFGRRSDAITDYYDGRLDEIRISDTARTEDWIVTEYNNQFDPSSFYSMSSEGNQNSWFNSDFMFRKTISINNSQVNSISDLTNFPVMIELFDSDLKSKTQFDGADIIFTDQLGTKLDHEIELFNQAYNSTHVQLVAWVEVTKLFATVDTNLFMYYGNSTIGTQENPDGVWDSNFEGVWHLSEDPTGTIFDSTVNDHDGTAQGGMVSNNQEQGKIGGSLHFDGTDDYISIPDDAVWTTGAGMQWTLQGWFNMDAYPGYSGYRAIIDNLDDTYGVQLTAESGPNATSVQIEFWDSPQSYYSPDTGVSPDSWHFIAVTVDFGTVDGGKYYLDGIEIGTFTTHTTPIDPSGLTLSGPSLITSFDGLLDELRFSTTIRPLGWTSTEYNNQKDPASFYSVSSEEVQLNWSYPDFQFKKKIIVDNTKVSGSTNLFDFPILIDLYDNNLKTVVQPDGDDIIFTDVTGTKLNHEIELFNQTYNSTHAHLITWVRVYSLSATVDTVITMYYGNSTIGTQENPTDVWDNNFIGVWHLGEASGGASAIKDSTLNANDGTNQGGIDLGTEGQIGGAIGIDAYGEYISIPDSSSLDRPSNAITVSAWTNADYYQYNIPVLAKDKAPTSPYTIWYMNSSNAVRYNLDGVAGVTSNVTITRQGWMHIILTYDGSKVRIYKDGSLAYSSSQTGTIKSNNFPLQFGQEEQFGDWFPGFLDEIRISDSVRSANWISTEYNNQIDPSSFYVVSYEEVQSYWPYPDFSYRKAITINNSKVNGTSTLLDFPILIDIYDNDLRTLVQADAADIIFADALGTKLDHEIELFNQTYNSTHAYLVAWVRIPSLFPSIDTQIYIYYGNSNVGSQENAENVWANSLAIWHLKENGSGISGEFEDSSTNNNHGQGGSGTGTKVPSRTLGKIGYGQLFDGSNDEIFIPYNSSLETITNQLTVQGWLYSSDTTPDGGIFFKGPTDGSNCDYCFTFEPDNIWLYSNGVTSSNNWNWNTGVVPTSGWHHYAYTYDGSTRKLYIDGIERASSSTTGSLTYNNFDVYLGWNPWEIPGFTDGKLDEIRVFNTSRSV